jgi:hypothetical protein
MIKSESISKLSDALSKAQGVIEGAKKDSSNPFFKSKYADLASVWEACRKPLSDNGLSVVQVFDETDKGVVVETILSHMSGEYIAGRMFIPISKIDAQTIGSAATYARRYGLQAIVGIAPEDDDGNSATGNEGSQYKKTDPKKSYQSQSYQKKTVVDDNNQELDILTIKDHYLDLLKCCNDIDETKEVMRKAWTDMSKFKNTKDYDLISHDFKKSYDDKNMSFKKG